MADLIDIQNKNLFDKTYLHKFTAKQNLNLRIPILINYLILRVPSKIICFIAESNFRKRHGQF